MRKHSETISLTVAYIRKHEAELQWGHYCCTSRHHVFRLSIVHSLVEASAFNKTQWQHITGSHFSVDYPFWLVGITVSVGCRGKCYNTCLLSVASNVSSLLSLQVYVLICVSFCIHSRDRPCYHFVLHQNIAKPSWFSFEPPSPLVQLKFCFSSCWSGQEEGGAVEAAVEAGCITLRPNS